MRLCILMRSGVGNKARCIYMYGGPQRLTRHPERHRACAKSRPPTVLGTLHARIVSLVLETYRFATQYQGISTSQTISLSLMEASL